MVYEYEKNVVAELKELGARYKTPSFYAMADEVREVYAKAKKLDKITELTDVPLNIEQDKTMIEVNKILNEYTR